jgi:nucleotide-binding universal stress UspA family protein
MPGIVVGVDGSDYSRHALRWAMREAALRQVTLTVISVHPEQVRPATMAYWGLAISPESSLDHELLRQKVLDFVDKVASESGEPVPEVAVSVPTGNVAVELVTASRDADMLVLGSRGSGGFGRLLMGSVCSQVAHHAACPVVITREVR